MWHMGLKNKQKLLSLRRKCWKLQHHNTSTMLNVVIFLLLCVNSIRCTDIYVDTGNPYSQGPLTTDSFFVDKLKDESPLRSLVYNPTTPGQYGVFFFITGFNGIAVLEFYTDYLQRVAQHGFIVVGSDLIPTDELEDLPATAAKDEALQLRGIEQTYLSQLHWLQANLSKLLESHAPGVEANWDRLAIGSHSAGADTVLWLVQRNPSICQAVVLMGPFTTNFWTPVKTSLPALMIQNELSVDATPPMPPCMFKEFGYLHVWSLWESSPKVRMNVKGYGHCAVGDMSLWAICNDLHVCKTNGNSSSLATYHSFAQGITAGFLTHYLAGYRPSLSYFTNTTLMPVALLDFAADI